MSNQQKNILKLDEEVLKHAAPIKHSWSMNNTSVDYGKATDSYYGHVVVDTNLNDSSNNPVSNKTINTAITQLTDEKANKNHASTTTEYGEATDSQYGHVKVDTELKNSINPVKNSVIYSAIDDINKDIEGIVSSLGTNTEGIKKLLNLNEPTETTDNINDLTEPGFYIYKGEEEKPLNKDTYNIINDDESKPVDENTYYNEALIFVIKNTTRIIQYIFSTKKVFDDRDPNVFEYKLNGSHYSRFGIITNNITQWSMLGLVYKPYTKSNLVTNIVAKDASINIYENASGFTIEWEQLNTKQSYEIVADELYAYETICEFNDLPIKGPFIFGNLIGKCDIRITPEKMELRSTLNKGNIIKNIHQTFFVPRV